MPENLLLGMSVLARGTQGRVLVDKGFCIMKLEIVVLYGEGWFGRVMHWLGQKWSHVMLKYNDRVVESTSDGIIERSFEEGIKGATEYKILKLRECIDPCAKNIIVAYAHGNVGKPYNYYWFAKMGLDLIRGKFRRVLQYPAHVCSSFVYSCFLYEDIDLVPGDNVMVLPDDIANSPLLEEVESGS